MNIEPRIVTFSWTESDWMLAQRQSRSRFSGLGSYLFKSVAIWGAFILCTTFVLQGIKGRIPTPQTIFDTLLIFLIFFVPLISFITAGPRVKKLAICRQMYHQTPEIFVGQSFEIHEKGLTYRQQQNGYTVPWKFISSAFLTKDFLVIVNEDFTANIMPRQIFLDDGKAWHDAILKIIGQSK